MAQKKGIEIIEGTREDLKTFESIMRVTGERDGFLTRPLTYFEDMYDTLAPSGMCKLYLAKLNTEQALTSIKQELNLTEKSIQNLQVQLDNEELTKKPHSTTGRIKEIIRSTSRRYHHVGNYYNLFW